MDAELYEQHAALERDHWWFVARRAIIEAVLARYLSPPTSRRILDVGCGTGGMLPMLAHFGAVTGIEGEPLALERCKESFGQYDVRAGRVPDDVPADRSLDVVTAFDVIEHIDDDDSALASFWTALRPGGTVVVTVPALSWLWSDHDVVNGHKRRYSRSQLVDLLRRSGFDVVHASYFNMVLLPAAAAVRLAQHLRRRQVVPHSDFTMPRSRVNRLLTRLMSAERLVVPSRGLPIGLSLVAVGRAAARSQTAQSPDGGDRSTH